MPGSTADVGGIMKRRKDFGGNRNPKNDRLVTAGQPPYKNTLHSVITVYETILTSEPSFARSAEVQSSSRSSLLLCEARADATNV